jgi:outer membrane lipoprotein-sorting protein
LHKLLTRPRVFTRRGKVVPPGTPPPPELNATLDDLNTRIANLYNAINSFQAIVQMTPSVGSVYKGKITESIVDVRSFVLFRKPDFIRIIGQAPVLRTNVFDMVSNGTDFRLYVVDKNLFFEGSDKEPAVTSKNALENLRPEAFLSAMLIRPLDPATEKAILEDDTDEDTALYKVHFIRTAPDGKLLLARSVWFDRLDLSIARQKAFNEKGEIISDTRYLKWQSYNGVMFPSHIDLNRYIDGYGVTMDILEMQMNKELTDDKFVLAQPEGTTIRRIGSPQTGGPQ